VEQWVNSGPVLPSDSTTGRPLYDPKAMLKLLIYGYASGTRSSRQLEKACYHNLAFIWLTGGLKPDHKTIASFRREHKELLKQALQECVRFCIQCNLIAGNVLFLDGTKIRANASSANSWTKERCEKSLKKIDERITALLEECEAVDRQEDGQSDHVYLPPELKDQKALKERVQNILAELKERNRSSHNTTDPDCAVMKSRQGIHAAHNVQQTVDGQHGLIVHADVVGEATDVRQFAEQTDKAEAALGKRPSAVCADAGYSCTEELEKVEAKGIDVVVPSNAQASGKTKEPFHHDAFIYDPKIDAYLCPAGQILPCIGNNKPGISLAYQISDPTVCRACRHWGLCTTSRKGRKITRLLNEEAKKRLEARYASAAGQEIYRGRKERAELPFGFIKRHLKADAFLLRGRAGALAETSLWATCFNIVRLIGLLGGVKPLVQRFQAV
jgi:transposase